MELPPEYKLVYEYPDKIKQDPIAESAPKNYLLDRADPPTIYQHPDDPDIGIGAPPRLPKKQKTLSQESLDGGKITYGITSPSQLPQNRPPSPNAETELTRETLSDSTGDPVVTPLTPEQELRRSKRLAKKRDLASTFAMALATTMSMDYEDLVSLTKCTRTETKESFGIITGASPSNYIPEPKRIKGLAHLNKHT
jgi:hypothetical protein